MVDFQSPGTRVVQVRKGPVILPGISTAIGGFLAYAEKGPIGEPIQVTSVNDAAEVFGGFVAGFDGQQLPDTLQNFFNEGGASCYVVRYIGVGYDSASRTLTTTGDATSGFIESDEGAFPVTLENGDTFIGAVDGGGNQTKTVNATAATKTLTGGSYAAGAATDSISFSIVVMGVTLTRTIDLSAVADNIDAYTDALNGVIGLKAINDGSDIVLTTDQKGSGAAASITALGGAAAAKLGAAVGAFTVGTGNVANVDQVLASELALILSYTGATETADDTLGKLSITSGTDGSSSSFQFTGGTGVAKIAGFDTALHQGADESTEDTIEVTASSPGSWGNVVGIKATRVDTTMTTCASNSAGSTSTLSITSAARLNIGDTISITKLTDTQRGVIQSINGNVVTFVSPITIPGGGYSTSQSVVLETFNLDVFAADGTKLYPTFTGLRMSALAGPRYFVTALAASLRTPITGVNLSAVAADPRPATDSVAVLMSGGSLGAAPVDNDIIGTQGPPATGIYAFNAAQDVSFISSPGNTSVAVQSALESYGATRGEVMIFHDTPVNTPAIGNNGVRDYIDNTVAFTSSNSAIHWPWVKRLDRNSTLAKYPPSPFVQGAFARTHFEKNFGQVAAGIGYGRLMSALDLETVILEQSAEYNDFYPSGGNAILSFRDSGAGGGGICIFGSRTLDHTGEFGQINVQIIFNVAKRQARIGTRFVNFLPNTSVTRASVVRTLTATYRQWRIAGILAGEQDADAFFIICDETNNTALVVNSGKMIVRVGLACIRPTEFLEIDFEIDTRAIDKTLATP